MLALSLGCDQSSFFQATGIDGNYRMTCEKVMEVLRQNKESLMAVLEAFVYDPLLNWRLVEGGGGCTLLPLSAVLTCLFSLSLLCSLASSPSLCCAHLPLLPLCAVHHSLSLQAGIATLFAGGCQM